MRAVVLVVVVLVFSLLKESCASGEAKPRSGRSRRKKNHVSRSSGLLPPWSGQQIRLIPDRSGNIPSGLVEVTIEGRRGIVCDDKWDARDADVVCKQLGFKLGAANATHQQRHAVLSYDNDDIVMDDVTCGEDAETLQECRYTYPSDCTVSEAAGVICKENLGCPDGWTAGPTGCYLVPSNMVSRREYAINKCIKLGGHLVTIESEMEQHFLSNAFARQIGPFLTGGVKKGGSWKWEKVEEVELEDQSQETENQKTRHTTLDTVGFTKWFPGWQPGNVYGEPTNKKKERCLFMTAIFQHPNGSDVTLDYLYWQGDQCTSTRKRMADGFHYICERTIDRFLDDIGCYYGSGSQYRGTASTTVQGNSCMKWTLDTDINPSSYPDTGLGDHNYCRNPDRDERPWCWVEPGNFEFCDIPQCQEDGAKDDDDTKQEEETVCAESHIMCSDTSCIPRPWVCDHEFDCPLGEDEQDCEYNLTLFRKLEQHSSRDHMVETYIGTTNETCAKYCLDADRFICRSFTYVPRTRECLLSDKNSLMTVPRVSRREDLYELRSFIDGCSDGKFMCNNGLCINDNHVCDGSIECKDASDEANCDYQTEVEVFDVRIAGPNNSSGPVEVQYLGEWGLICDDNWDARDAKVVCRMLGYHGKSSALTNMETINSREIFLDDVNCTGSERTLDKCIHAGWMNHNCFSWEVAGVTCSHSYQTDCAEGNQVQCGDLARCINMTSVCDGYCDCGGCTDENKCEPVVTLQSGQSESEGRIQIIRGGIVGSVCDDKFDDVDATVVCRSLGYSSGTQAKRGQFPPGTGVIWMDDVGCVGNEESLMDCPHIGRLNQDCGHDEDVGVICHNEEEHIDTAPQGTQLYLVEGPDRYSGRVEVVVNGTRGTICDDELEGVGARIICKMLGFRGGKVRSFGAGDQSLPILLDNVICEGNEETIFDCPHSGWGIHDCSHSEDVGVVCESLSPATHSTEQPSVETIPATSNKECLKENEPYVGTVRETEAEFECQSWSVDVPHQHKYHDDSMFPDGTATAASNFCRSPDGDKQPWCYTTDPDERWGYCNIPKCKENCYSVASEYTGHTSVTTDGNACQSWAQDTPHQHKYHDNNMFPDDTVADAANHCRSPDNDVTPWCYTSNENVRWQYCNIPRCSGTTVYHSNITCGNRPLELSRRRREADHSEEDLEDVFYDALEDVTDDDGDDSKNHIKYRKQSRIYGGNIAVYGMNPWQVGIRKRISTSFFNYNLHHCGGTIINEYWVLSAAHCFRDATKGMVTIRTGDYDHNRVDKYEQEFSVDLLVPHELYNLNLDYDHDIALLKVKPVNGRGIIFNEYVQPACLPEDTVAYTPGTKCLVSGWGAHEQDSQSDMLLSARVPLVDDRTCNLLYKGEITQNMVCAGHLAGGGDTCTGDSGGPLICKVDGKYTIMGVTSFGLGCGEANAPGVYARVASLLPWIRRTLDTYG